MISQATVGIALDYLNRVLAEETPDGENKETIEVSSLKLALQPDGTWVKNCYELEYTFEDEDCHQVCNSMIIEVSSPSYSSALYAFAQLPIR